MFKFTKNANGEAMRQNGEKCLRVGVFIDGSFLHHVSNYYKYINERRQRISIPGLQEYIRVKAAELEGVDRQYVHIVDSHFFRWRFSAKLSQANDKLYSERLFDDILISSNVQPHYMPISGNKETGVDVALALECLEGAMNGMYDVVALVAGDGDFVPLVVKLKRLGVRVLLAGWTFEYTDPQNGGTHQTTTSMRLIDEVTYPLAMQDVMNTPVTSRDPLVRQLFVELIPQPQSGGVAEVAGNGSLIGMVCSLKDGFGFICCNEYPNNIFFHYSAVVDGKFDDLIEGDNVAFSVETGERGELATNVRKI